MGVLALAAVGPLHGERVESTAALLHGRPTYDPTMLVHRLVKA